MLKFEITENLQAALASSPKSPELWSDKPVHPGDASAGGQLALSATLKGRENENGAENLTRWGTASALLGAAGHRQ
jgi:hypothetical protein